MLFDEFVDTRQNDEALSIEQANNQSLNRVNKYIKITKGWEILIHWKDGYTTWNTLKDVKDAYPIELAKYAMTNGLSNEPAFHWWVEYVIKKCQRCLAKVKSRYWIRTHKYGIKVPKSVKEALLIDTKNGNQLWWDAIMLEIKNIRPEFKKYNGKASSALMY